MKSNMKTIMENWDRFSKQDEQKILKEGFREMLLALSLFAGGTTMYMQMDDNEPTQQEIKDKLDKVASSTNLSDLPSFGISSGNQEPRERIINMIDATYADKLIPAPANDGYSYIPAFEIADSFQLPMVSVSVKDYKQFSDQFNLLELKSMLYGTSGKWAYNIQADTRAPFYSKDGQQILPPSWSVMYDVFRNKTITAIQNFEQVVDSPDELEKIAIASGFDSSSHLQSELADLKNLIEYN
jgi:hypothetical protein